jgi:hypothetical protein
MSEPSAQERGSLPAHRRAPTPVRHLSLAGVALLTIGAITYLVIPGAFGTQVADAGASQAGHAMAPGPMPGAPTRRATTSATAPPPGAPQASRDAPTAPTGAPTPLQPSDPALVKTWNSGLGGQALAAVIVESSSALIANAVGQYANMLQYCKALSVAAGNSESAASIPDTAMQAKYAAALSLFKLAAGNCTAGIRVVPDGVEDTTTEVNHTDVNLTATELSSAMPLLYIGTEMLRRQ